MAALSWAYRLGLQGVELKLLRACTRASWSKKGFPETGREIQVCTGQRVERRVNTKVAPFHPIPCQSVDRGGIDPCYVLLSRNQTGF